MRGDRVKTPPQVQVRGHGTKPVSPGFQATGASGRSWQECLVRVWLGPVLHDAEKTTQAAHPLVVLQPCSHSCAESTNGHPGLSPSFLHCGFAVKGRERFADWS